MRFEHGEPILDEVEEAAFEIVYDCLLGIILAYEDTWDEKADDYRESPVGLTPYAAAANVFSVLSSMQLGLSRAPEINTDKRPTRMRYLRHAAGEPAPLPKGHDPTIPF